MGSRGIRDWVQARERVCRNVGLWNPLRYRIISWHNDPYRHPPPYAYNAVNASDEVSWTTQFAHHPAQHTSSHNVPSWHFPNYPAGPLYTRPENYENNPPMADAMLNGGGPGDKKRKHHESREMPTEAKRIRMTGMPKNLATYPPQYHTNVQPTFSIAEGSDMAYVPSTGTYQPIAVQYTEQSPHVYSSLPALPGVTRFEQQHPARVAPLPTRTSREVTQMDMLGQSRGTQHDPLEIPSSAEEEKRTKSSRKKKKDYYAVAAGHAPGIYKHWADVEIQIKGYSGAKHQGFATHWEALTWLEQNRNIGNPQISSAGGFARAIHTTNTPSTVLPTDFRKSAERTLFPPDGLSTPAVPNGMQNPLQAPSLVPHAPATTIADLQQFRARTNDAIADAVPIVDPPLCKEQADLVHLILSGRNVFYTGSAGCGKSTVLKSFVKRFREIGMRVDIVAPTGRAALDINGSTTWTYAGWTPDHHKRPLDDLKKAGHGKFVSRRMKETDVLVVDEISMVENLHFERLNAVMKEARGNGRAFGGVQLIVTGDFCQLPPVKPFGHCIQCGKELAKLKDGAEYRCRTHGIYLDIDKWAFRSQAWEECDFAHVNLSTIHRQSDKVFIDILQKLRIGNPLLAKDRELLLKHEHQTRNAIMLFPTRAEVKRVNDDMFNKLRSQARTYICLDHFKWNEDHRNLESKKVTAADGRSLQALADHRYESQMQLKKGMLVVLLHNLDLPAGLVNGSQGTIQGFEDYDPSKMPKAAVKGKDSDVAHMGAPLVGDYAAFREQQMKDFIKQAPFNKWPIVTFLNGVTRTIYADCTVNELGDKAPHSLLSRTQIPLMAAWAMTTHKSQGMTLNRVRVDLGKAFEEGQAYVALSRARSLEGLEVISLPTPEKMGSGNPQVKEFLREKFGI